MYIRVPRTTVIGCPIIVDGRLILGILITVKFTYTYHTSNSEVYRGQAMMFAEFPLVHETNTYLECMVANKWWKKAWTRMEWTTG